MLLNGCLLNVILATGCLQWPRVKNRTQNTKIFEYLFQSVPPVPTYKLFCKFSKIRSLKQEIPTRILEHSTPNSQRHPSVTREREIATSFMQLLDGFPVQNRVVSTLSSPQSLVFASQVSIQLEQIQTKIFHLSRLYLLFLTLDL